MTLDNESDKNNFIYFLNIFENFRNNGFTMDENTFVNCLNKFGIDKFICIAINKIVSNLGYNDNQNKEELNKFYTFTTKMMKSKNYSLNDKLKNYYFFSLIKLNLHRKKRIK